MDRAPTDSARLERVRALRQRKPRDQSLSFLKPLFRQQVERPHHQVSVVTELWRRAVPADLLEHTRLEGLTRGVLRVGVDSSPHLYELDRLLRSGLQQRLIRDSGANGLRRVKLVRFDAGDEPTDQPQS